MGCLTASAGIQSGLHAQTIPEIEPIVPVYLGGAGVGAQNLTLRQLPPQKPSAILEQGVGRAEPQQWERQDHRIYDNPDWSLGVGALFQPADLDGKGGGPSVQTPIPVSSQIALEYIQNREAQSVPGAAGQRTVIPMPAQTNTSQAVLP